MWRKILLSAFLAVLLVQYTVSVPAPSAEDDDPSSNEIENDDVTSNKQDDETSPARKRLLLSTYENQTLLYNFELLRTYEISKDVLADPAVTGLDTEEMREQCSTLKNIAKYAKDALEAHLPPDKTDDESRFFFVMSKGYISNCFEKYVGGLIASQKSHHNATDAQNVMWQTLLRHGLNEYQKESTQRSELFVTNLVDNVLRYVDSLNTIELKKEKDLVKLCREYEQHKSYTDKLKFGFLLAHTHIGLISLSGVKE